MRVAELVRRNELPLCAISGREQMQQVAPLLDHLVGADDAVSAHHSSR